MKKMPVLFALIVMLLSVLIPKPAEAAEGFSDVKEDGPGQAHYDGIYWLSSDDIQGIDGYQDGSFKPGNGLLRKQAAKIFVDTLKLDTPDKDAAEQFWDIDTSHEYVDEIAAVSETGILTGNNDGVFMPEEKLSREQMASTLVRALDLDSSGLQAATIDLQGVDEFHRKNVQVLADLEITRELNDFRPGEAVTRGQFATFMHRSIEELDEEEEEDESDSDSKPEKPAPTPDPEPSVNIEKKNYNYNFQTMVNKQMNLTMLPQTSGAGTWYDASAGVTEHYLNPNNFDENSDGFYQFLKLSGSSGINANELNGSILKQKGILAGEGTTFKKASQQSNVNDVYLISHALLESGNGESELSTGVEVGKDEKGKAKKVTKNNRKKLNNIKTTYNLYGVGAVDSCPLKCGAERAYEEGWFTPEKGILGGAQFIGEKYINSGQDTLYKMRWNPNAPASHQYATDAGWAVKQTKRIKEMFEQYKHLDGHVMNFEVPVYQKQPKRSPLPTGADAFHVDTKHKTVGETAIVTADSLNVRKGPTTQFPVISKLPTGTKVTIIGINQEWYKVKTGQKEGWVSGHYLNIDGQKTKAASLESLISEKEEEVSPDIIIKHNSITIP